MKEDNNAEYRLTHGTHRSARTGDRVVAGETFVPTDSELENFPDRFERVVEERTVDDDPVNHNQETQADHEDPAVKEAFTGVTQDYIDDGEFLDEPFIERHWKNIQSDILSGQYDSVLGEIESAEQSRDGNTRASVMDAVGKRRG